ncbi:MAG: hypothetical protein KDD37_07010 [Bdellovibrionales bacterium]|nr:hypothetical protein [Bdellovibrionales bacterium]
MKVLISALVTLSVGTAVAATSATTVTNTGSSSTTLEQVAPKKSNVSTRVEFTNEKGQAALDNNSKDLETAIETKVTYKLSDTKSLRGSAYIQTLTREEQDDVHTNLYYVYLQYADSALFTIGNQAFRGAIRQYSMAFGDAQDEGLESVTRLYLSTPVKVNDSITVTPIINPRLYWGSNSREEAGAPKRDLLGILETEVAVNSTVSYTLDLMRRERTTNDGTAGRFELDNWATIALADRTAYTDAISMDLGFYHGGNTGNGFKLNKDGTVYYVRANVNF